MISPSNASKFASSVASEARPESLGRLSFAVGPVHDSMTDDEAETQFLRVMQSQGGQEHDLEEANPEVKESRVGTSG